MNYRYAHTKQLHIILAVCVIAITNCVPTTVLAHAFGYNTLTTYIESHGSTLTFHTEVPQPIPAEAHTEAEKLALYTSYFSGNFLITQSGQTCTLVVSNATVADTLTTWDGTILCPKTLTTLSELTITSTLFSDLFQAYDHFVTIKINQNDTYDAWDLIFNTDHQSYPDGVIATPTDSPRIKHPNAESQSQTSTTTATTASEEVATQNQTPSTSPSSRTATHASGMFLALATFYDHLETFWLRMTVVGSKFVWLGMIHIWSGYDHLLFLLSLILLLRSYKKILTIVTAFTVAHSITLILSSLHIITVSQRVVTPLVALSIVYMAVSNIIQLHKGEHADLLLNRWWFTAGFGLVHGLGFASALLDANIPPHFFLPSLVMFNVGIEIGQLVWLMVTVPVLLQIDEFTDRRTILLITSIITALLALCWFFQGILW